MFFSNSFLARKGPLGTVWCAAHLQHKLKKSHYTSTDIPSTVERIMCPVVPLALRMSGHLLLGVVRIYSKQVDYFYDYCNDVRITINRVFTSINVNLPEDANHAPYHSVTLPQTFDLDAMDVDDFYKDWGQDSHVKSQDDITLMDQVPTGKDPYIVVSFNEDDDLRDSSFTQENLASEAVLSEKDVTPPVQLDTDAGYMDRSPQSPLGIDERTIGNSSPQDPPSIEIMRNAKHDFHLNNSPILPDRADPDKYLEEQILKDKETYTPVRADAAFPDGLSLSSHRHQEHSFEHLDTSINFVHRTPEIKIQETPPAAQPKVQRRKRKRKQFFDESTVFGNQQIKNALSDTSGIRRVKKNCPCSLLDIWKVNNRIKKDSIFFEPLISGSCAAIQDIYKEDFITSKPHFLITEKEHLETNVSQSTNGNDDNIEIEHLRYNEYASPERSMPPFSNIMPPSTGRSGRSRRSHLNPQNSNHEFQSERLETTEGFGTLRTTRMGLSSGLTDSEMRTPETFFGDGLHHEHTALFDIPELLNSAGELGFLEQDDNSPTGSLGTPDFGLPSINQGTPELRVMSARTRAVAQYLKRQSSTTPLSAKSRESSSGDLSMNKILEGKPRKICARMFSETLVLKDYGLVDLHQEEPYNDITLKITLKLSKGQFSG